MTSQMTPQSHVREEAITLIESLCHEYSDRESNLYKANEARTRLLIIDRVLKVLGWAESDFNPEESIVGGSGYLDYMLTIERVPRLIVEAKRVAQTFRSPTNQMRRYEYKLSYLRSAFGAAFTEVLEQAMRYGQQTDVPFAVITNGAEWALIQTRQVVGHHDIEDLEGVYFGNLFSDGFHFENFWNLLYRPYVAEGSLEEYFGQLNSRIVDFSITPQSQFGDIRWQSSKTDTELRDFYRFFFTNLTDPRRHLMLERCFVSDSRLDQYRGELRRALKDSVPGYIPNAVSVSPAERDTILSSESGDARGRVILVTGSVGCGKSTLVAKVLAESQADQDSKNIYLVIDLIDEIGDERSDIVPTLWNQVADTWKTRQPKSYQLERLRKIFGREIKKLHQGPYAKVFEVDESELDRREAELLDKLSSDPETFLRGCWRYYQRIHKGIVVVLDNVDRASESYQRQVYAFAHKLASLTGATVIITMREVTYFRGQRGGFLDVRSSDIVFHLQAPNLESIIAERIKYVEERIDDDPRVGIWKKTKDWTLFRASIMEYALTLKATFLTPERGREILGLLAAVSWHNVRYFLELLRRLHIQLGGRNPWTVVEVIAALMTSTDAGGTERVLVNIFRPPNPNYMCYLVKIRILLMLTYGVQAHETTHGISYSRILRFMHLYGYQRSWVNRAIEEMVKERLLECIETPAEEDFTKQYVLSTDHSFRRSPLSVALIQSIVTQPIYLSLIGNDLPFHLPEAFARYKAAREDVMDCLGNELERGCVELVTDATDLGRIVAHYLANVYEDERPPENLLKNPEVAATERMLNPIIEKLQRFAGITAPFHTVNKLSWQPPLFVSADGNAINELAIDLPIPENIADAQIGRSGLGGLIFWALVFLRKHDRYFASGVEITEVINHCLVDDHNQKAPTNVSRALRHKTLQDQEWLITQPGPPPRYGVKENWQAYWTELFGEPVPDL